MENLGVPSLGEMSAYPTGNLWGGGVQGRVPNVEPTGISAYQLFMFFFLGGGQLGEMWLESDHMRTPPRLIDMRSTLPQEF